MTLEATITQELRRSLLWAAITFCLALVGGSISIAMIVHRESLGSTGLIVFFFLAMGSMCSLFAGPAIIILKATKIFLWFKLGSKNRARTGSIFFASAFFGIGAIYAYIFPHLIEKGGLNITLITCFSFALVFCAAFSYILFIKSIAN